MTEEQQGKLREEEQSFLAELISQAEDDAKKHFRQIIIWSIVTAVLIFGIGIGVGLLLAR